LWVGRNLGRTKDAEAHIGAAIVATLVCATTISIRSTLDDAGGFVRGAVGRGRTDFFRRRTVARLLSKAAFSMTASLSGIVAGEEQKNEIKR